MASLKAWFLLSRATWGWRKLPWDWRMLVIANGLNLLHVVWRVGEEVLGRHQGFPFTWLGPFVVRSSTGFVYLVAVTSVIDLIELAGLLFLARWAWTLGFVASVTSTAMFLASLVSGAAYEALKLGGFPLGQDRVWAKVTIAYGVICAVYAGILAWRILRRRAFLKACG